jgi:hypothetical protein
VYETRQRFPCSSYAEPPAGPSAGLFQAAGEEQTDAVNCCRLAGESTCNPLFWMKTKLPLPFPCGTATTQSFPHWMSVKPVIVTAGDAQLC